MKRRTVLAAAPLALLPFARAQGAPSIHVFKNPDCGCCNEWVGHLRREGFAVRVTEVADTAPVRRRLSMPERFGSCHTATVDGYVLEGHVPAADVRRLLTQRPKGVGLAVPGMPVGSPGMEVGDRTDPYEVLLVAPDGNASVFARYPA
jgi:hypothetical protein